MNAIKHHYIVIPSDKGQPMPFPLKLWVRQNLNHLPKGFEQPNLTSHMLRRKLTQIGWQLKFTANEVYVIKPDQNGNFNYANNLIDTNIEEDEEQEEANIEDESPLLFPIEAHLRDFLIKNLHTVKGYKLQLYIDSNNRDGREYHTEVGIIDILTMDENGDFVVFELKLSKGPDKALGQLLRYMGWIKQNLAKEKKVKGIIVANKMDDKIKYAVQMTPDVRLYEYELKFALTNLNA